MRNDYLKNVRAAREENQAARLARIRIASQLSPSELELEITRITRMLKDDRARTHLERGNRAFTPLSARDRGLLECWLENCQSTNQFQIIEDSALVEQLDCLRLNHLASTHLNREEIIVRGKEFREVSETLFVLANEHLRGFLDRCQIKARSTEISVLAPLRAGLAGTRAWLKLGVQRIAVIGIGRDELDAKVAVRFYEFEPPDWRASSLYVISDPMLATGGSVEEAIKWCQKRGATIGQIVVQAVVAAPEGVVLLLQRYPELRISTVALDGGLNSRAYIMAPGLGDFGDHLFRDIDELDIERYWGASGILPERGCQEVWKRTLALKSGSGMG